jgi:hypothetical protein
MYSMNYTAKNKLKIICLTPIYNEEKNILRFLKNNSSFVDGFIFLDDCSSDNSLDLLKHEKILKIIKKEQRDNFDDLENRNLLLKEVQNYDVDWILFLDADEDLYLPQLAEFRSFLEETHFEVIKFKRVHLWDSTKEYRLDYPYSYEGIQFRERLFRKKENMEITGGRLHFSPVPYKSSLTINSEFVMLHYGFLSKEDRLKKYNDYTKKYDSNLKYQKSYEHFLDENVTLGKLEDLK